MEEHAIRTGQGTATTGHGATISATEAIRWLDGGGQVWGSPEIVKDFVMPLPVGQR
jgi:hypothetical protein